MNPDRTRWGDSRLDDKFETITSELRALRDLPGKVGEFIAEVKVEIRNLKRDVDGCSKSVQAHREDFQTYVEEQERAHESHRLERKADRRWMIGTVFTAAALVIAALALLVNHL